MKNNPFLTVLLLFCIQVLLYKYFEYIDLSFKMGEDWISVFFVFLIPIVSVFLSIFMKESKYRKSFRIFTFLIVTASVLAFIVLFYLAALGRSFRN